MPGSFRDKGICSKMLEVPEKLSQKHWRKKVNKKRKQFSKLLSGACRHCLLISLECRDGCLKGALNKHLIGLIRQETECGDMFGLPVIPRAPLPLWVLYRRRL